MIKKNLLKSITAFVIVAILAFSIVGCNKTDNSGSDSVNVSDSGGGAEPTVENENHRFSYKETNEYLIKNGTTEYKIVIPSENVSAELNIARDELVRLFKEATGVTLETVSDAGKSHDANGKYISLGNTSLYKSSGLNVDTKTLKKDGARILTKDKTIYFIGKTDTGVINGVYDFLNMHFNFETYFKDTYTLTTGVTELKLMNYDVVDIPDIEYRTKKGILNASTSDVNDMMFAYRMRSLDSDSNMLLPIHSGNSKNSDWNINHNSFYFLPLDEYFETKRNFYSVAGNQLCFTAHGNTDDFNLMVDLCAEKITNSLQWYDPVNYPNYNAVIPTANPNKVLVDRIELVNGIKRVAVCSNPTTNLISMDIADNRINLTAQDIDFSVSANETITCSYDGEPISIGFKSTFLVEILSNMDTPTVVVELADSTRAGVFKPVYDDKQTSATLMLLMPMMINA